jgi:hypothetical protein
MGIYPPWDQLYAKWGGFSIPRSGYAAAWPSPRRPASHRPDQRKGVGQIVMLSPGFLTAASFATTQHKKCPALPSAQHFCFEYRTIFSLNNLDRTQNRFENIRKSLFGAKLSGSLLTDSPDGKLAGRSKTIF